MSGFPTMVRRRLGPYRRMMVTGVTAERRERVRMDITGIRRRCLPPRQLLYEVAVRLRQAIPFSGGYIAVFDPMTLLPAEGLVLDLPYELARPSIDNELAEPDLLKFAGLARRSCPAATLLAESSERPRDSARFRNLMRPAGAGDALRIVFRSGDTCWGCADLWRAGRPFEPVEVAYAAALSDPISRLLGAAAAGHVPDDPAPGMLVIDRRGTIESASMQARRWLPGLSVGPPAADRVPEPVHAVVAKAQANATAARAMTRWNDDRWLVLHAARLDGDRTGVVISVAQPADLMPLLMRAYGLSPRERQVAVTLARGASTAQVARALSISQHTVKDHVKATLGKVGVTSRSELVATLTGGASNASANAAGGVQPSNRSASGPGSSGAKWS